MANEGRSVKKVQLDFTDVPKEKRKRSKKIPEGDYLAKITKVERRKAQSGEGATYFNWAFQILSSGNGDKKHAGTVLYSNTSLKPQALFNLRNLILAVTGKNVAGKSLSFDANNLVGKQVGITVEDEEWEYEGKSGIRSNIVDFISVDEISASEDDEDEDGDEDDDDEDDDSSDDEDDDEDDMDDVDYEDM